MREQRHRFVDLLLVLAADVRLLQAVEILLHLLHLFVGFDVFAHVELVALRRGDTARGDVRLLQEAFLAEQAHFVAERRAGHLERRTRHQIQRTDRFRRLDELVDNGREELRLTRIHVSDYSTLLA